MSLVVLAGLAVGLAATGLVATSAEGQQIPDWIKTNALWWAEGKISDSEYATALTYLAGQGIITIPEPDTAEPTSTTQNEDMGDFYLIVDGTNINRDYLENIIGEEIDYLNELYKLPYDIPVTIEYCNEANAYWYSGEKRIGFCYELLDWYVDNLSAHYGDGEWEDKVSDNVRMVLYHEVGHAMFDVWNLPFTGKEENVADQFSAFTAWELWDDDSYNNHLLNAATNYHIVWTEYGYSEEALSGVHALDPQRFYNLVCHVYGANPDDSLIDYEWITERRASTCVWEFEDMLDGMYSLMSDYMYL